MANIGIALGGFTEGLNQARGVRQRQQQIDLNKRRIEQEEQNSLFERAQANVSQLIQRSQQLTEFGVQNAAILNQSPEGQKVLRDVFTAAKSAAEKAGQAGAKAGVQVPEYGVIFEGARQVAESTPTPEQQRDQELQTLEQQETVKQRVASEFREPRKPDLMEGIDSDGNPLGTFDVSVREGVQQAQAAGAVRFLKPGTVESPTREGQGLLSGTSKPIEEFKEVETSTLTVIDELDRIEEQVADESSAVGLLGKTIRGLDSLAGEYRQFNEKIFGVDDSELLDPGQYDFSAFTAEAAKSSALQSNVTNLAYMLARAAEPGGRLSDPDVQRQINRIGANTGSIDQIKANIDEIRRATITRYHNERNSLIRFSGEDVAQQLPGIPDKLTRTEPKTPEEIEEAIKKLEKELGINE